MSKVKDANKESDRLTAAGNSAVYKAEKLKSEIKEALKDPEMKQAVMDFIFSGDPEAESPLAEIRSKNK